MRFNERLKAIRKECGMTQREVYSKLNISPNGYASYEQGRTEPSIDTLVKLCQIFDVSADVLLGLKD
jgi:transcriptional regulator with XRE-family HTH domain